MAGWLDPDIEQAVLLPTVAVTLPDRCANLACPNRPGEGRFQLLQWPRREGHARGVLLLLCAPCVNALTEPNPGLAP